LSNVCQSYHAKTGSWCRIQAARRQERERVARLANMAHNIKFYINDTVIENVTEFKYLGRIISADDYDDGAVNFNITQASKTWYRMYRILSRDTADSHVMAQFIWLSFKPNYYMALKHGSYPNVPSRDLNPFITDVLVLKHIVQFIHFQMALGNIHQLKKYWIFADCQISQHTLHGARQGCSTDMLNLRAHCIICVRTPLQ
jgi:hypothetical protein